MKRNRRNDCLFLKQVRLANKPHKSVGNERDELFALLKEASFTYRKEVIGESKLYELYVEDFLNGHYYSDHRDAAGKNRHWKNIGILRGILTKRKDLVEQFFSNILFAPNRMDELLRLFNTTKASSGLKKNRISHALKRTFLPCLWVAF